MKRYHQTKHYRSYSEKRWEKKGKKNLIWAFLIIIFLIISFFTWLLPTIIGGFTFINKFKDTPKPTPPVADQTTLAPPVLNIPYEATNSATIKIKGYASSDNEVKIYVDEEVQSTTKTAEDGSFTSDDIPLSSGTNNIYGVTADEAGHTSLPSKTIKIVYSNAKPKLDISSPSDNQAIQGGDKKITVSGKVSPVEGISVTANGVRFIVKDDGSFSQSIDINEGENNLTITAADKAGNSTQISKKVTYTP